MTLRCPHCKNRLKVIVAKGEKVRKTRTNFESTASNPPQGLVKSFLWFMSGNKPGPKNEDKQLITLRVEETSKSRKQILITEAGLPLDENEMLEIAYLYTSPIKLPWTRENTVSKTSLSQGKHNTLTQRFLALGMLDNVGTDKMPSYRLTKRGRWFLMAMLPDGVYSYNLGHVNKH